MELNSRAASRASLAILNLCMSLYFHEESGETLTVDLSVHPSNCLKSLLRMRFHYAIEAAVVFALLCSTAGAMPQLPTLSLNKRLQLCVGVTGDFCFPGLLECCDDSTVCLVDLDGRAVSFKMCWSVLFDQMYADLVVDMYANSNGQRLR